MIALRIAADLARVIAHRWPVLLAWWLGGVVMRDLALRAAAEVAMVSPFGGALALSLAMLTRLLVFVAMLLVVRDELDQLRGEEDAPGRGAFARSLLTAALPFAAFYLASGLLEQDWRGYLEVAGGRWLAEHLGDETPAPDLWVIGLNLPTLIVIAACLVARIGWRRLQGRAPWWIGAGAVVVEVLWVFLTAFVVDDGLATLWEWLQTRQLSVWIEDARSWLAALAAPLAWVWDAAAPAVTIVFEAVIVPIAWMLTAATVYGRSLADADAPVGSLRRRTATAMADAANDHVATVRDGARLVRRTGPVLLAAYCLLFALIELVEPLTFFLVTRAIGPHAKGDLIGAMLPAISLIPSMVVTPILIALVAAACNAAVARIATAGPPAGSERPGEQQDVDGGVGGRHAHGDDEVLARVARDEEDRA
ncbi:hypothetical protein [Microbacterium marinilacus]|uniref:Uncharacterized protein n=1 Tax=Microbacterium marinilacus TaxID=415209 RepID=A0ABP7BL43_9MICO|nr:hypothetical protein [Microbacterium marinilacus]MBY0689736.1 hypothetical protein [Microbacterium marinilacus]